MKYKRIFLIVLDSVGIGEALDAKEYGDYGANTLKNVLSTTNIQLPNLEKMGLLNLINGSDTKSNSYYARIYERSIGKDTLTGHLEMMGIITTKPPLTFTKFPQELIKELEKETGRKFIGNKVASGTEIIKELGKEHIETEKLIIYTSADSVLQIAAHEDVIPLEELYQICKIARELTMKEQWKVGRVIARPFKGTNGNYIRISKRRDYALNPPQKTVLNYLKKNNLDVISIGKISDIFNNWGITQSIKTENNLDGIKQVINVIKSNDFKGLCFINLNDFDSLAGHRRDSVKYGELLVEFDNYLLKIIKELTENDLLLITSDHGNDPTYKGTDHTREDVFLLCYNKNLKYPKKLNDLNTMAVIGKTILENFSIISSIKGESILHKLK